MFKFSSECFQGLDWAKVVVKGICRQCKTLTSCSWTVCCNAESNLIRIDFVIGSLVSTDFERLWEPLRIFLTMKEWVGSKTLYNLWT